MSKRILNRTALWAGLVFVAFTTLGGGCSKPTTGGLDASTPADVGAPPPDAAAPGLDASSPDTGPELVPCSFDDDCGPA